MFLRYTRQNIKNIKNRYYGTNNLQPINILVNDNVNKIEHITKKYETV
jgi:hypothetical protein